MKIVASLLILLNIGLYAENTISIYGGYQTAPHSNVSGVDHNGNSFDFTAGWEGKSFAMPPYYGVRFTHWYTNEWAITLDYSHTKVYADDETKLKSGFTTLEFTDGLNILTINVLRRYTIEDSNFRPYWGLGAGITLPHVEVQTSPTAPSTFEFQFGGFALQAQLGLAYPIAEKWTAFAEYKFNYSLNRVDLTGGGNLDTNLVTNALDIGISYSF